MGVRLRIQAVLLKWPPCCACCLGPSQTKYTVFYTTQKVSNMHTTTYIGGQTASHSSYIWHPEETKEFFVPICRQCLEHAKLKDQAGIIRPPSMVELMIPGAGISLMVSGLAFVVALVATFVLANSLRARDSFPSVWISIVCSVLLGVGLLSGGLFLTYHMVKRQHADLTRTRSRQLADIDSTLKQTMSSQCASEGDPVVY